LDKNQRVKRILRNFSKTACSYS